MKLNDALDKLHKETEHIRKSRQPSIRKLKWLTKPSVRYNTRTGTASISGSVKIKNKVRHIECCIDQLGEVTLYVDDRIYKTHKQRENELKTGDLSFVARNIKRETR